MRLIPGKTKVQIELFKGVTLWDILVGGIAMGLAILVIISSLEGKVVFLSIVLFFAVLLILRLDTQPNYVMLLHMFQHFGFVRRYRKVYDDETLKKKAKNELVDDYLKEYREEHADDNAAEEDANYGDSAEYDYAQGDGTEEDRITNGYESYESDTYENGDSYVEEPYETESYETDIPYEASYSGDDGFYEDDEFLAYHDDDTQVLENTSKVKGLDKKSGAKKSRKATFWPSRPLWRKPPSSPKSSPPPPKSGTTPLPPSTNSSKFGRASVPCPAKSTRKSGPSSRA
jgi:hypothetical protein